LVMKTNFGLFFILAAATAGFAAESTNSPPRFSHSREITNTFLPLSSLKQDILQSKSARIERTARPELRKSFKVGGQTVEALVVEDREFEDGKLAEVALDYFAQSDDGTVYYLGEDVDEYKGGKISGHSGAWLYGEQTQTPGVLMPAQPKAGDKFKPEDVPKVTWEEDEVVALGETVSVPAGKFTGCVKIREKLSDGKTEFKYYAPGVGCVKEVEEDAEFVLKSHNGAKAGQ
jgi:hypothetical protein